MSASLKRSVWCSPGKTAGFRFASAARGGNGISGPVSRMSSLWNAQRCQIPKTVSAPTQYGERVRACAIYLHQYQLVPYQRVSEALHDLAGCSVSAGSIATWVTDCAERLEPFTAEVLAELQRSDVQHNDETGAFLNGVCIGCMSPVHLTLPDIFSIRSAGVPPWMPAEL